MNTPMDTKYKQVLEVAASITLVPIFMQAINMELANLRIQHTPLLTTLTLTDEIGVTILAVGEAATVEEALSNLANKLEPMIHSIVYHETGDKLC